MAWAGVPGWSLSPQIAESSEQTAHAHPRPHPRPRRPLPEPCGAALDRIHLTRQHRIRAWRVSRGLCHLTPSFLLSGVRPGSPRRLPSDTFITSCSRNRQSSPEPLLREDLQADPGLWGKVILNSTRGLSPGSL